MTMQPRGIRNNNPGNIRWGDTGKVLFQKTNELTVLFVSLLM